MNGEGHDGDRELRRRIMDRLYEAWRAEGLYRGVVGRRDLAAELDAVGVELERNLEYLQDMGLVRMHKIEDLLSITTAGIDYLESGGSGGDPAMLALESLGRIEDLLGRILRRLEKAD